MRSRLYFVVGFLTLWMGGIGARLFHLQVDRHDEFARRAERQQQRVIELDPPRGTIFDARGRELAVSIEVESAFAVPREIENVKATAAAIAAIVPLDAKKLERQLASDREFVWVARKLDPPQARAIRDRELPGLYFLEESKRYYPLRELAAHVLGYVGTDNQGLAGLEAMYDKVVAGKPGRRTVLRDARKGMAVPPNLPSAAPVAGGDLHLTLDATLQQIAEQELDRAARELRVKSGSVVLLDPDSGAVLAMASWPRFDPNRFGDASADARRNRPVTDAYEPGSTFKMVTAAAALEEGLVDPDETFDCEYGGITLAGVRISDHKSFGNLTFREVIAKSSNVGTIKTALRVSNATFYSTIRAFGFGRTSGIDLPGESPGLLMPVERWPKLAKAYISFGQGLSVTPLQLTLAFGTVANGGRLLEPFVVRQLRTGADAEVRHAVVTERSRPVSGRTIETLRVLLAGVTMQGGTGRQAAVAGYPVAGKTGTAQKALPGKGYLNNEFIASFAGFAPLDRPALVAAVVLDDPRGTYHGGEAAAPVFEAIVRQALLYLNVRPEREAPEIWPREEPEPELPVGPGEIVLAQAGGEPDPAVEPPAAMPIPAVRDALPVAGVPDLAGLTARQALAATSGLRLRPVIVGSGVVRRQKPVAGSPVPDPGTSIELFLEPGIAGAGG